MNKDELVEKFKKLPQIYQAGVILGAINWTYISHGMIKGHANPGLGQLIMMADMFYLGYVLGKRDMQITVRDERFDND